MDQHSAPANFAAPVRIVRAPGRVNLIGDHTDYSGGVVFPMAIQLTTDIAIFETHIDTVTVTSDQRHDTVSFQLPVENPQQIEPYWGRYVGGVASLVDDPIGFTGHVSSTIPVGSGLSSSAALEVAAAYALEASGTPLELAQLCQEAEFVATGVPCGIMDQLASVAGARGHGLLIDCSTFEYEHVPIPEDVSIWVIHSGQERALANSEYKERFESCALATKLIGPLPQATFSDINSLPTETLKARARHVRTECDRVISYTQALDTADFKAAGAIMQQSHESLATEFQVSTPQLDSLVEELSNHPDVHGARLTGAGFGGCVVALAKKGADLSNVHARAWRVEAGDGAARLNS